MTDPDLRDKLVDLEQRASQNERAAWWQGVVVGAVAVLAIKAAIVIVRWSV